ncbi:MAG: LamG domain-containing protein, partial [Candidatus Mariimomonas ferrooxydans]
MDARYDKHEIFSREPVTEEGWKHIVFTWDMTSGLALYLNGEQVASSVGKDAWWIAQFPGILHIPSDQYTMDELYIIDRPVTTQEVSDLYTSNKPPESIQSPVREDPDAGIRLAKKSGISTALNLPVITPSDGKRTLQFEEVWIEDIGDGKIPGP